jgi:hypothetical protein
MHSQRLRNLQMLLCGTTCMNVECMVNSRHIASFSMMPCVYTEFSPAVCQSLAGVILKTWYNMQAQTLWA